MKKNSSRGLVHVCDECECLVYARTPNEQEKAAEAEAKRLVSGWHFTYWHCPVCGLNFKDYISCFDNYED